MASPKEPNDKDKNTLKNATDDKSPKNPPNGTTTGENKPGSSSSSSSSSGTTSSSSSTKKSNGITTTTKSEKVPQSSKPKDSASRETSPKSTSPAKSPSLKSTGSESPLSKSNPNVPPKSPSTNQAVAGSVVQISIRSKADPAAANSEPKKEPQQVSVGNQTRGGLKFANTPNPNNNPANKPLKKCAGRRSRSGSSRGRAKRRSSSRGTPRRKSRDCSRNRCRSQSQRRRRRCCYVESSSSSSDDDASMFPSQFMWMMSSMNSTADYYKQQIAHQHAAQAKAMEEEMCCLQAMMVNPEPQPRKMNMCDLEEIIGVEGHAGLSDKQVAITLRPYNPAGGLPEYPLIDLKSLKLFASGEKETVDCKCSAVEASSGCCAETNEDHSSTSSCSCYPASPAPQQQPCCAPCSCGCYPTCQQYPWYAPPCYPPIIQPTVIPIPIPYPVPWTGPGPNQQTCDDEDRSDSCIHIGRRSLLDGNGNDWAYEARRTSMNAPQTAGLEWPNDLDNGSSPSTSSNVNIRLTRGYHKIQM